MSFLHDGRIKLFFGLILVILLLFSVANLWLDAERQRGADEMLAEHDAAIASSLIKSGISVETAARALVNKEVNDGGRELIDKLGIREQRGARIKVSDVVKLLLLAIFLFAALFFFLLKRERLYKEAIETVSEYSSGDFSRRLPQSEEGTIFKLFSGVSNMAAVLKSKQENEKKTKVFLKNTISDISHQFKTPIAALSMYNEIIASEPENANVVKEFSEKSERSINRMKTLVSELLKVVRLDAGSVEFNKKTYSVPDVVGRSVEELKTRAEKEEKEIVLVGERDAEIYCDISWTCEAIGNIVKNALDHTTRGEHVNVAWEITPLMTRISVSDNGEGISPEDIHHIFKRFYKSRHSGDSDGVGLGLPLAKAVVEGQGGTVSVSSEIGRGSEFVLSFLTKM